jgi:hypothetical protein
MLENLFVPLFEATLHPEDHPEIAEAMKHIVGFDSVDDEGVIEEPSASCTRPKDSTNSKNPAYWWQLYFLWANLEVQFSTRSEGHDPSTNLHSDPMLEKPAIPCIWQPPTCYVTPSTTAYYSTHKSLCNTFITSINWDF